jgi:hypothetical protein
LKWETVRKEFQMSWKPDNLIKNERRMVGVKHGEQACMMSGLEPYRREKMVEIDELLVDGWDEG